MTFNFQTKLAVAVVAAAGGCGDGGSESSDPRSRQLVHISHVSSTPIASLAISEDGSYRFLDEQSRSEVAGQLDPAELRALQGHVNQASIRDLAANEVTDARCRSDELAYRVISKFDNSCIVAEEISDASIRAHADFLIQLFSTKSAVP